MATRILTTISPLLLLAGLLAASCATPGPGRVPRARDARSSGATAVRPPDAASKRRSHELRPEYPERRPQLGVTTPMRGEPSGAALSEARLVASSCEKTASEDLEARLEEMRKAVDRSFKEWHDEQPACWEAMRQEYLWRKSQSGDASSGGDSFGGAGHASFSAAGIGVRAAGAAAGRPVPRPAQAVGAWGKDEPGKARTASGTNNQVAGVDEADIVKTDGRYVYLAANGALRIVEALRPRVVSTTRLEGTTRELFVDGDRAVVYTSTGFVGRRCTYGYECAFGGDGTSTKVSVFDISNPSEPKLVRELALSGSLIAARRIGGTVHTVVSDGDTQQPPYETWPEDLGMCGTIESTVRAKFAKLKAENEKKIRAKSTSFPTLTEKGKTQPLCSTLFRTPIRDGQAFTTVVSFDMTDDAGSPSTATVQSRPGAVFASTDALYLSVVHQKPNAGRWYSYYAPSVDEVSEIHKFRIGPSPRDTRYAGSGTVPGHVLNQFAMDEWYGYLRIATTKGRVPDPHVESAVSILAETANGNLARVGAVEKIAPGEDIRAVRFDGDRGYVVTFKKTDPLFVLDLFEPGRPQILGELKIPGFSTYIHRIDPEHLLSIGFDANDHGDFAYFDGVILQLFEVKNPIAPRLLHKEKIGTRGSSSEAATDHLAFNWFASEGLLAVPMTICEGGGDGRNGDQLAFSGLLVFDVDVERGFTRLGGVDHGTKGVSCGTWWSNASSAVKRSVFLDDLVYSIATDRVKVQRMNQLGIDVADLSLLP